MHATHVRRGTRPRPQRPRLTTRQVKRLAYDSRSIDALTALWAGGVVLFATAIVAGVRLQGLEGVSLEAQLLLILVLALAAIECHQRTVAGRILGAFVCLLTILTQTVIGAAIGGLGLLVIVRSGRLFGPHRLDAHKLRFNLEARRKNGIR